MRFYYDARNVNVDSYDLHFMRFNDTIGWERDRAGRSTRMGVSQVDRLEDVIAEARSNTSKHSVVWHNVEKGISSEFQGQAEDSVMMMGYPMTFLYIHFPEHFFWFRFGGVQTTQIAHTGQSYDGVQSRPIVHLGPSSLNITDYSFDDTSGASRTIVKGNEDIWELIEVITKKPSETPFTAHFFCDPLIQAVRNQMSRSS